VSVSPDATTREALGLITSHDISQLPVCVGDECVGSLSESSLMIRVIEDPTILERPVRDFMDDALPCIDADVSLTGVGRLLSRQTPAVLVREGGRLAGIVTRYDVVRYLTA
jgi:cystathionine beta-synthase